MTLSLDMSKYNVGNESAHEIDSEALKKNIEEVKMSLAKVKEAEVKVFEELERRKMQ